MLIGIDMLCVQSPQGANREAGRYGRQLVASLLADDPVHNYILYAHEGFPTHRLPASRNASRVSLAPIPGGSNRLRPTIQRVIDRNPDGLDWLILLDPFEPNYCSMPPESPLSDLKIASLLLDLAPTIADDRRLSPLRRHDAIFGVSEATASECRRRLGSASRRVTTIGVATDPSLTINGGTEPLTRVSGEELGRLGITGPFLFAHVVGGNERANLAGVIDAYHRLPFPDRRRHQLVIAGSVRDPWTVMAYLYDRGCAEGLVLVGDVPEATLQMLYQRCSAFVSPSIDEGCGLTLIEAMSAGAALIAGHSGAQPGLIGDAGLLADPADPVEISRQLAHLLSDADLEHELRTRAVLRVSQFGWEPVVRTVLATLEVAGHSAEGRRLRVDTPHVARPRIAVFPEVSLVTSGTFKIAGQIPLAWSRSYAVDLYLEPEFSSLLDGISADFGGFDARQFDRNDGLLGYHAVVYQVAKIDDLERKLGRLRTRPGLVLLGDDPCVDRLGIELDDEAVTKTLAQLRELFRTSSRLGVHSSERVEKITHQFPEFASQIVELSVDSALILDQIEKCAVELSRGARHQAHRSEADLRPKGSTPHSARSSFQDDDVTSRSR